MSLSETSKTVFGRSVPQTPEVKTYIANLPRDEDQTKAWRLFMLLSENYRQETAANAPIEPPPREWHSLDLGKAFLRPAANIRPEKRLTSLKRKIHNLNEVDAAAAIKSLRQAVATKTPSPTIDRIFAP